MHVVPSQQEVIVALRWRELSAEVDSALAARRASLGLPLCSYPRKSSRPMQPITCTSVVPLLPVVFWKGFMAG